MQYIS